MSKDINSPKDEKTEHDNKETTNKNNLENNSSQDESKGLHDSNQITDNNDEVVEAAGTNESEHNLNDSESIADSNDDIEPQKQKSKKKMLLFLGAIPLLVILITGLSYGAFLYNKAQSVMDNSYQPVDRDKPQRPAPENPEDKLNDFSILFLGVDESDVRKEKGSRTDAMILATFNASQKSIKMLSIPRDSYVFIPDSDTHSRINHAHSWGGVKSTLETVELLLDIPIDYYVKMNFKAFMEVVEAIDGVEVNVPYEFYEQDSRDRKKKIHLMPGWQRLNGEEALAFVRTRKLDTDVDRGKRQQEVLRAIMKKSMSMSSITKYGDIMDAVGKNMATDLPFSEIKNLMDYAAKGPNLKVDSLVLKGDDLWVIENGKRVYYYEVDEDDLQITQNILKRHLNLPVAADNDTDNNSENENDNLN